MNLRALLSVMAAGMVGLLFAPAAMAETAYDFRPVVIDGGKTDARTAHFIAEPNKGHIGYHHARTKAPALWFQLDGNFGDTLYLRMGVPTLDRYRLLRPAIAVLGQGMPALPEGLPFDVPEGFGGRIYYTADLDVEHHEDKYAGVVSWRFETIEHVLETSGRTYVVGFVPVSDEDRASGAAVDGKFWMTIGNQANFRLSDLLRTHSRILRVRRFFEDAVTSSQINRNSILGMLIAVLISMIAVA